MQVLSLSYVKHDHRLFLMVCRCGKLLTCIRTVEPNMVNTTIFTCCSVTGQHIPSSDNQLVCMLKVFEISVHLCLHSVSCHVSHALYYM